MLQIETFILNPFQENSYLIWETDFGEALLIDAGCYEKHEFEMVEHFLSEHELTLTGLANTHCHIDHILGVPYFRNSYNLPFRAHKDESRLVQNAHLMGKIFGLNVQPFPELDSFIEPGDEIRVGTHIFQAIHVPGHSQGSLSFYCREAGIVLTGDALFRGSIGRTDLPGGNYDQLIHSIQNNLFVLPPETEVYPGHGESSTIAIELDSNPYF
ncbi:MAG: MBL fold metallo-hydrolase [Bacteroidales bacterium]|nr:MBL fold metallo-hydrolase [Bacteroidales bacterium]MBN2698225.1 MBL fold metallo-hydrolase [Bacteroidales bacterium]